MNKEHSNTAAEKRLSRLQRTVLAWILTDTRAYEEWYKDNEEQIKNHRYPHLMTPWLTWGVPWKCEGYSRSESSAMSRALKRLESRGLLLRQCQASTNLRTDKTQPAPPRCTSVLLTLRGRMVAESLAKETVSTEQESQC